MKPNKHNFENDSKNLITWEGTSLLCNEQAKTLSSNTKSARLFQRLIPLGETKLWMVFRTSFPVLTSLSNLYVFCGKKNSSSTKTKAKLDAKLGWYDEDIVFSVLSSSIIKRRILRSTQGATAKGKPKCRYLVTFHNSTLQNCLFFLYFIHSLTH